MIETKQEIKTYFDGDVVVIGGGPAGVSAAVSAARNGLKTCLIERYGWLGGQATGGHVIWLPKYNDGEKIITQGFFKETIDLLKDYKAVEETEDEWIFHPEYLKYIYDLNVEEENINLKLHSWAIDAEVNKNKIESIYIVSKSGFEKVKANYYIDATGDGDIAEWCNVPYKKANKENIRPVTTVFRMANVNEEKASEYMENNPELKEKAVNEYNFNPRWVTTVNEKEIWMDNIHMHEIDVTSSNDLTIAEIEGRRRTIEAVDFYKNNIPGFESAYLVSTAPQLGVRESRLIEGKYFLTKNDLKEAKEFEDSVALIINRISDDVKTSQVPYRSFITEEVDNLIFSGRCIGVSHDILDFVREIPICAVLGEVAGYATVVANNNNQKINEINVLKLRKILKDNNCIF